MQVQIRDVAMLCSDDQWGCLVQKREMLASRAMNWRRAMFSCEDYCYAGSFKEAGKSFRCPSSLFLL